MRRIIVSPWGQVQSFEGSPRSRRCLRFFPLPLFILLYIEHQGWNRRRRLSGPPFGSRGGLRSIIDGCFLFVTGDERGSSEASFKWTTPGGLLHTWKLFLDRVSPTSWGRFSFPFTAFFCGVAEIILVSLQNIFVAVRCWDDLEIPCSTKVSPSPLSASCERFRRGVRLPPSLLCRSKVTLLMISQSSFSCYDTERDINDHMKAKKLISILAPNSDYCRRINLDFPPFFSFKTGRKGRGRDARDCCLCCV